MTTLPCSACGAAFEPSLPQCPYCGTTRPTTAENPHEALDGFIRTIEVRVDGARADANGKVALALIVALTFTTAVVIVTAKSGLGTFAVVALGVIMGCGALLAWGAFIEHAERNAMNAAYETSIRREIDAWLGAKKIRRVDLDERAAKILAEKARLRQFLFRA